MPASETFASLIWWSLRWNSGTIIFMNKNQLFSLRVNKTWRRSWNIGSRTIISWQSGSKRITLKKSLKTLLESSLQVTNRGNWSFIVLHRYFQKYKNTFIKLGVPLYGFLKFLQVFDFSRGKKITVVFKKCKVKVKVKYKICSSRLG